MKATKGQAVTTAVFAMLKIVVGIVVFALFKVLIDTAVRIGRYEGMTIPQQPSVGWWIFGLPFIVPGALGCVAAGVRNRVSYGLYMAACIIACVVQAVFCFVSFVFLFAMAETGGVDCAPVAGQCVCSSPALDSAPATIGIADCEDLGKVVHLSYGLCSMMILGWILCLAGSIVSCASCCTCCGQQPGAIVMMNSYPGQVVTTTTQYTPSQYPDVQYAQPPPQYAAPPSGDVEDKNQYKYNRMY